MTERRECEIETAQCQCCGTEEIQVKFYKDTAPIFSGNKRMTNDVWLCELCAQTTASNCVIYNSERHFENRELFGLILYCTNKILQKLENDN